MMIMMMMNINRMDHISHRNFTNVCPLQVKLDSWAEHEANGRAESQDPQAKCDTAWIARGNIFNAA